MLQATVLGSGFTPGQAIHTRGRARAGQPGETTRQDFAQPLSLDPSSAAASSSSSAVFAPIAPHGSSSFTTSEARAGPTSSLASAARYDFGDEALTWVGNQVTWSRGAEVIRRFTPVDGHDPASIICVTFAWLPLMAGAGAGPSSSSMTPTSSAGSSGSSLSGVSVPPSHSPPDTGAPSTFGPFHTSQHSIWGDAIKRTDHLRDASEKHRCVVIVLSSAAHLYFATGEEIRINMPCPMHAMWPLSTGGILFQRSLEDREQPGAQQHRERERKRPRLSAFDRTMMSVLDDLEGEPPAPLPMLYTLTERYGELKLVPEASLTGGVRDPTPTVVPGSLNPSITTAQTVLYVAPDPFPFVVVYDKDERRIVFFRRAIVPLEKDDTPSVLPPHMMLLTPEDLLRQAASPVRHGDGPRPSLSRARPITGGGARASLAPPVADPLDRTHRKSRLSTTSFVADDGEFDFGPFATEPVPAVPGLPSAGRLKRVSAIGVAGGAVPEPVARRASMGRGGRRISSAAAEKRVDWEFPKTLGLLAEDLRETTMMQGLSNDAKRSEVVLDRIWEWSPPGRIDPAKTRVFLSDNHSKDSVFFNILLTPEGFPTTLFTFHVEVVSAPTAKYVFHELRATQCLAATSVICTRPGVLDTLVVTAQGTQILSPSGRMMSVMIPPITTVDGRDEVARKLASSLSMTLEGNQDTHGGIVDLVDASGPRVTVVYGDGERIRVSLDLTLPPGLTRRALEGLSYALTQSEFEELNEAFLVALQAYPASQRLDPGVHWQALEETLLAKCGIPKVSRVDGRGESQAAWITQSDPVLRRLAKRVRQPRPQETTHNAVTPAPSTPRVVVALHLVAQDCRLACTTEQELPLIARVIISLASALGRSDWVDYWRRVMPTALSGAVLTSPTSDINTSVLDSWDEPPDVLSYLERRMLYRTKPFPTPQALSTGAPSPLGNPLPCAQTALLMDIYGRMRPSSSDRSSTRAAAVDKRAISVVQYLVSKALTHTWLANVPFGVSTPILEMVRACHTAGPKGMLEEFYTFIGRPDLAANCQLDKSTLDLPFGEDQGSDEVPTVGQLLEAHPTKQASRPVNLPHVRFGTDKRLEEIERIMQTTRQRTMAIDAPKGTSEADVLNFHQQVVSTISQRTLSITVGQGMFQYASHSTPVTTLWKAPRIELSVKVVPGNTVYNAPMPEGVEWPCFHSGVSSALAFSSECKGITASWIGYNRPSPLTPDHAGFLLGLGLQGHLRVLDRSSAYTYLDPRHDFTTIGMTLGLGASFAGSQDQTVTRLLSLHTTALLPLGSMPLGQSPTVQCVALVALGLVYAGSRNLRMAEVTLHEISRHEMPGIEAFGAHREAYNFSAAAAFGLIMLGRGGLDTSGIERTMVQHLTLCIRGNAPDVGVGLSKDPAIDTTVTAPGATLALGLMFLKTNRKDIASILSIPQTPLELESVRPEHLLVRTFARALIMWDEVEGMPAWFDAQLPPFIRSQHHDHKRTSHMELNSEVAYFNIMAGACLGLAFRHAGSANESIHNILTNVFGLFAKAAAGQSMSYEGKIRRNAARQALNIVSLAAAIEMSGTGELGLTRRLRMSHGQEGASINYGSHMAMHMAMGILYLGRGYYTLGNSNLAIAALAISCFPRFLPGMGDNRSYPQAFRHLWALAVEPRCLIARDVDTRESIFLPVKLFSQASPQANNLISPTLIAPMDTLKSIVIDTPRYLPVTFDFSDPRDWATLVQTRTIWVKRRAGYIDYAADPRGYRSLMVRAGTMSGFDLHYDLISPAAPMTVPPSDVIELVTTHSTNPVCIAIARNFSGDTWLEKFARNVLFECLSIDKLVVLGTYLSMALGLRASSHRDADELLLERIAQVRFAHRFYRAQVWDQFFSLAAGQKRHPVLRQTFLAGLMRTLGADDESFALDSAAQAVAGGEKMFLAPILGPDVRREYFKLAANANRMDAGDAAQLSAYLVRNNVPPLRVLELLRQRVSAVDDNEGDGKIQAIALQCRVVAERYTRAVLAQYGDAADPHPLAADADVGLWKFDSVVEAVSMWLREAGVIEAEVAI